VHDIPRYHVSETGSVNTFHLLARLQRGREFSLCLGI
jgi:hypothetical protein